MGRTILQARKKLQEQIERLKSPAGASQEAANTIPPAGAAAPATN
jgi:hypothetical protein